jgi:outer membrane protein TolC
MQQNLHARALALAALCTLGAVGRGSGQTTAADTFRLDAALDVAVTANPKLRAARLRADAAIERVSQAGALPDPRLALGLMNRPVSDFGTSERMTMNQVQLTQTLPWPGKLGFSEERAERLAAAAAHDADEAAAMLVARVTAVYFELAYMDRALTTMGATRGLLRDFFQVSQAMYAVGSGLQQDVLQAQVAIARMSEDITVMEQERVAMSARLNALLGREVTAAVGALELPAVLPELPSLDSLIGVAVARRPALRAAYERVEAAEAGYRASRRELYPDFMLTVGYGQRPQYDDMVTAMVGISIPLWAGAKQLPKRREMQAMKTMQEAQVSDLYNETLARLTELRAEAERARSLAQLYATAIVPQARASVEAALSAYRVGRVDYMTLVNNEMTVNRYEIESVRLTVQFHQAASEIEALVGGMAGGQS